MDYGYVRVSSSDQNEIRQILSMRNVHVNDENIFIDKQSGKDFNRPQYQRMISTIKQNDLLYIQSIDRLGRNYAEIQEQWRYLTKIKEIDICVIDMPVLDTRTYKDLLGTFVSDLILQILSFVAESERNNIKKRQAEGIAAAKIRGVKFGRPEIPISDDFPEICKRWKKGEISGPQAATLSNLKVGTFYYKAKKVV